MRVCLLTGLRRRANRTDKAGSQETRKNLIMAFWLLNTCSESLRVPWFPAQTQISVFELSRLRLLALNAQTPPRPPASGRQHASYPTIRSQAHSLALAATSGSSGFE